MDLTTLGIHDFWVFLTAGVMLNLTPGQDTFYIMGRSIAEGRGAGIASALGVGTGGLVHVAAATLGISAVFSVSALAFTLVKILGVAYLTYLGLSMLLKSGPAGSAEVAVGKIRPSSLRVAYRRGILTNVLNPKVAIFFLAFLPQFVDMNARYRSLSYLVLGGTFMFTGTAWCLVIAVASSMASQGFRRSRAAEKAVRRVAGAMFIGLAVRLALEHRD